MFKIVQTDEAPKAIGPYSQAVIHEDLIFCSGQIGMNPKTGQLVSESVAEQTRQVLENIENILVNAGSSLSHVLKSTIFLTSMDDFEVVNAIYMRFFHEPFPARSTVEVSKLPRAAKVEIEVLARVGSSQSQKSR